MASQFSKNNERNNKMIKIVVFDCGYGGEFFADRFEEEIPVVDLIRVIDWRHAEQHLNSIRESRNLAEEALRPYINKVDLIILANHLLSITSLKYFKRKYPKQKFIGFSLKMPDTFVQRDTLIITTKAVTKTMEYHGFLFRLKRKVKTITVDTWPSKIDDGELTDEEISETISTFTQKKHIHPEEIILGNAQLEDIIASIRKIFGHNLKIYSSFNDTIREACKTLHIRGSVTKKN